MSTGALWWYPGGSLTLASLSVRVARLTITPERQGVAAQALSGRVYHATAGQADRVDLELSVALALTSDDTLGTIRDQLGSLEDHLLSGGVIGLAGYSAQAWAARLAAGALTTAGSTTFAAANGLPSAVQGALAVGSRLVLRDLSVRERREENTVDAVSAPSVTLVHGTLAGLSGGGIARERHTYPALRLAPDGRRPMRVDPDGVTYRFSASLIEDVGLAAELLGQPALLQGRVMAEPIATGATLATPRGLGSRSWVLP
jgi:hypothetical protein